MIFLMKKSTLSNLKALLIETRRTWSTSYTKGFVDPNKRDMVCKLHKALYGLKQSPRAWYERFHNYLIQIGFQRSNDNNSLYIKEGPENKIVLAKIFVDDTLFTGNDDLCK